MFEGKIYIFLPSLQILEHVDEKGLVSLIRRLEEGWLGEVTTLRRRWTDVHYDPDNVLTFEELQAQVVNVLAGQVLQALEILRHIATSFLAGWTNDWKFLSVRCWHFSWPSGKQFHDHLKSCKSSPEAL